MADTVAALIDRIADELAARYIFPDRAVSAGDAIRRANRDGGYGGLTEASLAERLTTDLQAVTQDLHLRVYAEGAPAGAAPDAALPGIDRADVLADNIGYLAPHRFSPIESFAPEADQALRTLATTKALIVDLRTTKGGSPQSVGYLCSFFFAPDRPVHLNTLHWRDAPSQESWTRPTPVFYRHPVFVLTSRTTFSGAEEFANNLKILKRASIVGERTRGGAHPGRRFPLGAGFEIFIPVGRAENPLTKANWEGTGVSPDVELSADAALAFALATVS